MRFPAMMRACGNNRRGSGQQHGREPRLHGSEVLPVIMKLDYACNSATRSGACCFALEGGCAKMASCARHLDWRELATAMERSSLLRHRASSSEERRVGRA